MINCITINYFYGVNRFACLILSLSIFFLFVAQSECFRLHQLCSIQKDKGKCSVHVICGNLHVSILRWVNFAKSPSNFYFKGWIVTTNGDEVVTCGTTALLTDGDEVAAEEDVHLIWVTRSFRPLQTCRPPACALFWGSCRTWLCGSHKSSNVVRRSWGGWKTVLC